MLECHQKLISLAPIKTMCLVADNLVKICRSIDEISCSQADTHWIFLLLSRGRAKLSAHTVKTTLADGESLSVGSGMLLEQSTYN